MELEQAKTNFLFHIMSEATLKGSGEEANLAARRMNTDIKDSLMVVCDSTGEPLVKGGLYEFRDEVVSILDERYGCGNIADTYYHVSYMKPGNIQSSVCIEQNGGSIYGGWTYRSNFKPYQK